MTITDALDEFLLQLRADGRSPHTLAQRRRHVLLLARWAVERGLGEAVAAFSPPELARFLTSALVAGRQAATTNAIRSSLRMFFGYLRAAGHLAQDPTRLTRRAIVGPPVPTCLSDADQGRLLRALEAGRSPTEVRDRVLFELLLRTGLRIGSALALDVGDVDLEEAELHLRGAKGNREERLPIASRVRDLLREWIGERRTGPLFPGRGGGRLSPRHVQRRFKLWVDRAGIERPASPHVLRHSFATGLYRRTGDLCVVKAALRHRSIESTLIYLRVERCGLLRAIETLDATWCARHDGSEPEQNPTQRSRDHGALRSADFTPHHSSPTEGRREDR